MPSLMLAAPLLRLLGVGETTMKWLAPAVTVGAAVLLLIGLWLGGVAGFAWIQHSDNDVVRTAARAEVQAKWDADRLAWSARLAVLTADYRSREHQMQASADAESRKGKEREARITADLRLALDQLRRDRNARPGGPGGDPGPAATAADGRPGTCDGRGLYADDAEVLARLAARAKRTDGYLRQCIDQYNAAREALRSPATR